MSDCAQCGKPVTVNDFVLVSVLKTAFSGGVEEKWMVPCHSSCRDEFERESERVA